MRRWVLLATFATGLLVPVAVFAQNKPAANNPAASLDAAKEKFVAEQGKARDALIAQFDAAENLVRKSNVNADVRLALLKRLKDQRTALANNNTLPDMDEMLGAVLQYHRAVHKARLPLAKVYGQLIDIALKTKDDSNAEALRKEFDKLERDALGPKTLDPRSHWAGARHGIRGANVDFQLHLTGKKGDSFTANLFMDRGNVEMRVAGLTDGNLVTMKVTQVVRGRGQVREFAGVVVDKRMILEDRVINNNGVVGAGLIVLTKQ